MTDQNQLNEGQLGKFFENRRNTTEDELKQLREVGKVKVALTFNKESWARIAVNLLNLELKKKYMSELEETDPQTQDALSNSKSSSVVGWRGYLSESKARKSLSKEMEELNKLRNEKLVQKSLQNSRKAYEKAAHILFQPNEVLLNLKSQNQKRAGNCLINDMRLDDSDIESEIQSMLKIQTETLVGAVFRIPSKSTCKLNRERISLKSSQSQASPLSEESERDSTATDVSMKSEKRHSVKRKLKASTLQHRRPQHKGKKMLSHAAKSWLQADPLEEMSENESVSSTTTLKGFKLPASPTPSPLGISAAPVLHADEKTEKEEVGKETHVEGDFLSSSENKNLLEQKSEGGLVCETTQISLCTEKKIPIHDLANGSLPSFTPCSTDFANTVESHSDKLRGDSAEDNSPAVLSRAFSSESHISSSLMTHSNRSSINITSFEEDETGCTSDSNEDVTMFDSGSAPYQRSSEPVADVEDEFPVLPPVNGSEPLGSQDATWSWIDRLQNPTTQRSISNDSNSSMGGSSIYQSSVESPLISDSSYHTSAAADPGFTPFVQGTVHPLSLGLDDEEVVIPRWKGTKLPEGVWEDPGFIKYSNGLNHEPTADDVVTYKMIELSEEIEIKFGKKLEQAIQEAVILAMKDQLSYLTFHKLCQRLALQANEFKERAVLITVMGRNLWEKLPDFQEKIRGFTSKAVEDFFSVFLEISSGGEFSETRYDYDDWDGLTETAEVKKMILSENTPILDSIENLPNALLSSGQVQLPPFPPNPKDYLDYLKSQPTKLKKCRSVEVLFKEEFEPSSESECKDSTENQATEVISKRYNPPARTLSESTIDTEGAVHRKGSDVSVFESIPEEMESFDVIKANDRQEVLSHLMRNRDVGSLSRPIVLSTSSTESCFSRSRPNSGLNRQGSSTSSSLSSTSDSPAPSRKTSGIIPPKIETVMEVTEITEVHQTSGNNQLNEIRYNHITMIKKRSQTPESQGESYDNNNTDDTPDQGDNGATGRRRSSVEAAADIIAPTLTLILPLAVLTALAIGKT